jgi:ribosomal protein S18 acetylase RimI-like enzyme
MRHDILKQHDPAPPVSLRVATPEDAARLAFIGRATFLETYAGMLPAADILAHCQTQHAPEAYAAWLVDQRCRCWLVEASHGAAPVGYLVLAPAGVPVKDPDPANLEVTRIYLLHRFQRAGTGRRLMDACMQYARAAGCPRLLLGVYSRNDHALKFYERMGFERVGERSFRVGGSNYHDYVLGHDL